MGTVSEAAFEIKCSLLHTRTPTRTLSLSLFLSHSLFFLLLSLFSQKTLKNESYSLQKKNRSRKPKAHRTQKVTALTLVEWRVYLLQPFFLSAQTGYVNAEAQGLFGRMLLFILVIRPTL